MQKCGSAVVMDNHPQVSEEQVRDALLEIQQGDLAAKEQLFQLLYSELYARARQHMNGQAVGVSLQATELVNEVFLRLGRPTVRSWDSRQHFMATASLAMRHVLVDYHRKKKRRGHAVDLEVGELAAEFEDRSIDLEVLNIALEELREADPTMAQAVDLRFFGGVCVDDAAKMLDLSPRTFARRWASTRAWLFRRVSRG